MLTFSYSRESSNLYSIHVIAKYSYITAIFLIKEEEAEILITKL
jgi:hypothetical protein